MSHAKNKEEEEEKKRYKVKKESWNKSGNLQAQNEKIINVYLWSRVMVNLCISTCEATFWEL